MEKNPEFGLSWESHVLGLIPDLLRPEQMGHGGRFKCLTALKVEEVRSLEDVQQKYEATREAIDKLFTPFWPEMRALLLKLAEFRGNFLYLAKESDANFIASTHAIPVTWIMHWFQHSEWARGNAGSGRTHKATSSLPLVRRLWSHVPDAKERLLYTGRWIQNPEMPLDAHLIESGQIVWTQINRPSPDSVPVASSSCMAYVVLVDNFESRLIPLHLLLYLSPGPSASLFILLHFCIYVYADTCLISMCGLFKAHQGKGAITEPTLRDTSGFRRDVVVLIRLDSLPPHDAAAASKHRRRVGKGPTDFILAEALSPLDPLAILSSENPTMPNNVRKRSDRALPLVADDGRASKVGKTAYRLELPHQEL